MKTTDMMMKIRVDRSGIPDFPYRNLDQYHRTLATILATQLCAGQYYTTVFRETRDEIYTYLSAGEKPEPAPGITINISGPAPERFDEFVEQFRSRPS